jgi:hypothetical protein
VKNPNRDDTKIVPDRTLKDRNGRSLSIILKATIGIAIDVLAMVLPSVGCALWSRGHRLRAVMAWALWPVMVGLSLMGTVGFFATHIGDAIAARLSTVTKATNAASDLQQWRDERKAITEKRTVEELKLQLARDRPKVDRIDRDAFEVTVGCARLTADTMKACGPVLPILQALETAKRRDKLDRAAESKQDGAPAATSADADPQATQVSKLLAWITRGKIAPNPDDIALVRLVWSMVPSLAGLVLMFATGLLAAPGTKHE